MAKFVIFWTDDNGRSYGDPVGMVEMNEFGDEEGMWLKEKQAAKRLWIKENPGVIASGSEGWITAIKYTDEEIAEKQERVRQSLAAWTFGE